MPGSDWRGVGARSGGVEWVARRGLRAAWDRVEARLDHPAGRPMLLAASKLAIAIQYRERCQVAWSDGAWEYRWPDVIVISERPLLVRARPEECAEHYLWDYKPVAGDTVFDVGAGIGSEVYDFASRVGPEGRVYAFEAHPGTFRLLERLCELNGWSNVEPILGAVVETLGTVTISDDDSYESNDIFRAGGFEVPGYALDGFVAERGIERIDLIKMNIEGAEVAAVRGMARSASRTQHMVISCHDFLEGAEKKTKASVRDWLTRNGFQVRERPNVMPVSIQHFLYASRRDSSSSRAEGADEAR